MPKKLRPGDDPEFIKKRIEDRQKRADFVKEHAEYYKKTPESVINSSPYADARSTNDMRPTSPENAKAREEIWKRVTKSNSTQVTPGKWTTKNKK